MEIKLSEEHTNTMHLKTYESPCVNFEWGSPEQMFQAKVEHLMELLGCSEAKATHLILHYL